MNTFFKTLLSPKIPPEKSEITGLIMNRKKNGTNKITNVATLSETINSGFEKKLYMKTVRAAEPNTIKIITEK